MSPGPRARAQARSTSNFSSEKLVSKNRLRIIQPKSMQLLFDSSQQTRWGPQSTVACVHASHQMALGSILCSKFLDDAMYIDSSLLIDS